MRRNQGRSDIIQTAARGLQKLVFLFLCTITAAASRAEDLTTTRGQTYHDAQVLSRNSSSLLIQSKEGEFQIALAELKQSDREKYSKDLIKAIELPALTVIGEQKVDFSTSPTGSRTETLALKEIQRQEEEKKEAAKKRAESYQPFQITKSISFSLGSADPRTDNAMQPDYLKADYQRLAPELVEKDLKAFGLSPQNP